MRSYELAKENISWATGISVVVEDESSRQQRVNKAQGYYHKKEELASLAVTDLVNREMDGPAVDSVRWFAIQTRWERTYLMPKSLPRKRWLEISGYRIPLPSKS